MVEPRHDTAHGALDCELARELISADADGELRGGERLRLATHLDDCLACEAYAQHVARLNRQVRLRAAVAAPDFVDRVMARSRPPRLGRGGWLRPALAWCGVLIASQSIRPLVFGDLDGTPTHVARHVGASALALGVGLLYAAWRPHRAFGLLPLVGALLATTLFGTVLDTAAGARSAAAETVHLAELVGMVLLWMVAGSPGSDRVTGLWPGRHARRSHRGAAPTTR